MPTIRVFRLFGDFRWPPSKPADDKDAPKVAGVVEIWFSGTDEDGWRALLRWTEADGYSFEPTELELPAEASNVFEKTFSIDQTFGSADAPAATAALWISKPASGADVGEKLHFSGAFLIDQFDTAPGPDDGKDNQAAPLSRWPLVRHFVNTKGSKTYPHWSGLVIGQPNNDSFRLNLALPMPVRQTTSKEYTNPRLMPFSTVYTSTPKPRKAIVNFGNYVAGAWGEGEGRTRNILGLCDLDDRHLGRFGIGLSPEDEKKFLNLSRPKETAKWQSSDFWPTGTKFEALDLLQRLGFDVVSLRGKDAIETASVSGPNPHEKTAPEDVLSIRFLPPDQKARTYGFIYRLTFDAAKTTAAGGDVAIVSKKVDAATLKKPDEKLSENRFRLRFKEQLGGWLDLDAKTIKADIAVRWTIPDTALAAWQKTNAAPDLVCSVQTRLFWEQSIDLNAATDPAGMDLPVFRNGALGAVTRAMADTQAALLDVAAGQPQSFLPQWTTTVERIDVVFALTVEPISATIGAEGLEWTAERDKPGPAAVNLSLAAPDDMTPAKAEPEKHLIELRSWFPGFDTAPTGPTKHRHITLHPFSGAVEAGQFAAFAIRNSAALESQPHPDDPADQHTHHRSLQGRLGALEFSASGALLDDGGDGRLTILSRRPLLRAREGKTSTTFPLGFRLTLRFNIDDVTPVAVDRPWGARDRKSTPLLVRDVKEKSPEGAAASKAPSQFVLVVTESATGEDDRHLTSTLIERSSEKAPDETYTVLSDQPFGLFRFTRKPLSAMGDAESAEVATFDSDERVWQFKQDKPHYHFVFPAQAIGETSDKPGRLEINDLAKSATGRFRPYPESEADAQTLPLRTHLVEYRLSPSAELWIKPSDLDRGYYLPEWGAHDIFRQRGDFGLGAAVEGFRAEFLYGLSVGVDIRRETGAARQARIAEVEALTGILPAETVAAGDHPALQQRWRAVRPSMKSRHERLEFWTADPESTRPFKPARFEAGVDFALRRSALHRSPLVRRPTQVTGPAAPSDYPPPQVFGPDGQGLRLHEQGLAGGALWPLESWTVLEELLKDPASLGGVLDHPVLAPTGGSGEFKAFFLGGILAIAAVVRDGFVERQRVEILGRIGAFWHRAKHVVVYERTTTPSAQFAPELNDDWRSRRTVLRKVSEFVELLEPARAYPDREVATARISGFLDSVRFNSTVIPVDSAWSSEIDGVGFKIPLWNRGAARLKPQVYLRPDVDFVTVGEGAEDRPLVSQECLDPDNLCFFADVASRNPDTDQWPSRIGIDFADALDAGKMAAMLDSGPAPESGKKPSAPRMLPAYRRFTWRLAPGGFKTQLNATRGQKPLYAGLESVTFMRMPSSPKLDADHSDHADQRAVVSFVAGGKELDQLKGVVGDTPVWAAGTRPAPGHPAAELARLHQAMTGLAEDVAEGRVVDVAPVKDMLKDLDLRFQELFGSASPFATHAAAITNAGDKWQSTLELQSVLDVAKTGEKGCERFAEEAIAGLRRKRLLLGEAVRSAQTGMRQEIEGWRLIPVPGQPTEFGSTEAFKRSVRTWVLKKAVDHIRPALGEATTLIGDVSTDTEKVRGIISDVQADMQETLRRMLARLDAMAKSYSDGKPWSHHRLQAFERQLGGEIAGIRGQVDAAIEEARLRFSGELGKVSHQIGSLAARALSDAAAARFVFSSIAADGRCATVLLAAHIRSALAKIDGSGGGLDTIAGVLETARKKDRGGRYSSEIEKAENALVKLKDISIQATGAVGVFETLGVSSFENLNHEAALLEKALKDASLEQKAALQTLRDAASAFGADVLFSIRAELDAGADALEQQVQHLADWVWEPAERFDDFVGKLLTSARKQVEANLHAAAGLAQDLAGLLDEHFADLTARMSGLQRRLDSEGLLGHIEQKALAPAIDTGLARIDDGILGPLLAKIALGETAAQTALGEIRSLLNGALDIAVNALVDSGGFLDRLDSAMDDIEDEIQKTCVSITSTLGDMAEGFADPLKQLSERYREQFERYRAQLDKFLTDADTLKQNIEAFRKAASDLEGEVRAVVNSVSAAAENAKAYGNRVLEAAANIGRGDAGAIPRSLLKLYSAATSAPEIALLQANIDRIRCSFSEIEDVIATTRANVLFARLGDALKAMGLNFPFDGLGDSFRPDLKELEGFDLSRLFPNFAGLNLGDLFKGSKATAALAAGIKISHDIDEKAGIVWVRIDVDSRVEHRMELFSVAGFALGFLKSRFVGSIRLEASKDSEEIRETTASSIITDIETVISGQLVVAMRHATIGYDGKLGSFFDFDPANLELNQVFKLVQDALGGLFPDELGGLRMIKEDGIPVGVEHELLMPDLGLMYGTSGVSGIDLANRFMLRAYPDFVIANRFNLSGPEKPFLISIFIIGGTGYLQADVEYRPATKSLTVAVEAAAGGSAALGFSFGPVHGSVFITLSIAISYRHDSGGESGLSVALLLVIAGNVRIFGIATVYLGLMLRLSYRSSGQVDGVGTLSVSLRISRFFKLSYRTTVTYKLRDGKATTVQSSETTVEPDKQRQALQEKAGRLQKARS
ncbi:hypothetical protein QBK99_05600 [Corticibacterium sp. UT-5YL-CI-8]|nr:hypothetical protein [Tianweitania sp. UT-5YL-CI-8]